MVLRHPKKGDEVEGLDLSPSNAQSAEEMRALRHLVDQEMLKEVLKTYAGRRVIWNILCKGDIYNMNGKSYDPHVVQRQLGRDEVAQEVLADALTAMPDIYTMLRKEALEFDLAYSLEQFTGKDDEDV